MPRAACPWRCRTSPTASADYLERIDALVVTGGAFDVDPVLLWRRGRHATVITKDRRTAFEFGVTQGSAGGQTSRCWASAAASSCCMSCWAAS